MLKFNLLDLISNGRFETNFYFILQHLWSLIRYCFKLILLLIFYDWLNIFPTSVSNFNKNDKINFVTETYDQYLLTSKRTFSMIARKLSIKIKNPVLGVLFIWSKIMFFFINFEIFWLYQKFYVIFFCNIYLCVFY